MADKKIYRCWAIAEFDPFHVSPISRKKVFGKHQVEQSDPFYCFAAYKDELTDRADEVIKNWTIKKKYWFANAYDNMKCSVQWEEIDNPDFDAKKYLNQIDYEEYVKQNTPTEV
jgi:hypothetical protein